MIPRGAIPVVLSIGIGLLFALIGRFLLDGPLAERAGGLLTVSFLLFMPAAIGGITAHFLPQKSLFSRVFLLPWLNVVLFVFTTFVFHLEGAICLIIIGPLYLLLASLGALLCTLADKRPPGQPPRNKALVLAGFAVLPYLAAGLENHLPVPDSFRRVENHIDIAAAAPVVWQHIIRVDSIGAHELPPSRTDALGFPRPVAATLTREGVGGVRHATFERGVEFIETVDDWQPLRRLSFRIDPNTATIPPSTFDEHVTVGGRFFDVLRGTYELRPLPGGHTRLVLYSEQRVSTHLNWYAGWWTRYVMSEIQGRILAVLKQRCEAMSMGATVKRRPVAQTTKAGA